MKVRAPLRPSANLRKARGTAASSQLGPGPERRQPADRFALGLGLGTGRQRHQQQYGRHDLDVGNMLTQKPAGTHQRARLQEDRASRRPAVGGAGPSFDSRGQSSELLHTPARTPATSAL